MSEGTTVEVAWHSNAAHTLVSIPTSTADAGPPSPTAPAPARTRAATKANPRFAIHVPFPQNSLVRRFAAFAQIPAAASRQERPRLPDVVDHGMAVQAGDTVRIRLTERSRAHTLVMVRGLLLLTFIFL